MLHLEDRSRVSLYLFLDCAPGRVRVSGRWLQQVYLGLEHRAGCSGCTVDWNIALVAADVLRWLQRMY